MIRYVAVLGKLSEDGLVFDRYECMGGDIRLNRA